MEHEYTRHVAALLSADALEQAVDLCLSMSDTDGLEEILLGWERLPEHARRLLALCCPDAATAAREERLWACDCLEPHLPALCELQQRSPARDMLALIRRYAVGEADRAALEDAREALTSASASRPLPAAWRSRRSFQLPGGAGLVVHLASEPLDSAQLVSRLARLLAHQEGQQVNERFEKSLASAQASRVGALGPQAARLRQIAAHDQEQAALTLVRTTSGGVSPSRWPRVVEDQHRQARLLLDRCRPYLRHKAGFGG